jgi:O-antigen/teichoic acid export membrane protein
MESIRNSMARGAAWMVAFKLLDRSLGIVSTLILARLLLPKDFGLVAMATSLIALLELFTAFGFDTALIQRSEATRAHYNTAWTLNVAAGLLIGTAMVVLAWPASLFYHEPRVIAVISALAVGALVQGCENVGVVAFRKEMRFDREFRFLIAKKVIAFATTVPLAFALRNYWALVAGMLMSRVGGVALSYALHPFRPRLSFAAVADLMHFSKWLVVQNVLSFLKERSADFIIGRFAGPHALGIFAVSAEVSNMPATELVAPINRAVLPAYAKLAGDKAALRREYLSVMSLVALLAVPVVAGLAVTAPFLVLLFLGPKWQDAVAIVTVLAFFGITQVLQSNAYSAFLALGKPQVFVKITAIHVCIELPALVTLTAWFGINGAAWAYVTAAIVVLPVNFIFITRFLELPARQFISQLWRPLCSSGVMYVVVHLYGPPAPGSVIPATQAAGSLAASILLGAPVYIASVIGLWLVSGKPPGAEMWILKEIQSRGMRAWTLLRSAFVRG